VPGGEGQKSVLAVPRGWCGAPGSPCRSTAARWRAAGRSSSSCACQLAAARGGAPWRRLLWQRLRIEEMGAGKEEAAAQGKSIIDLERWERGKQMFVMGRFRKKGAKRARDEGPGDAEGAAGPSTGASGESDSGARPSEAGETREALLRIQRVRRRRRSLRRSLRERESGSLRTTARWGEEEKEEEEEEGEEGEEEEDEEGEGGLNLGVLKEMSSEEEEAARRLSLLALLEEREKGVGRIAAAVQRMRKAEAASALGFGPPRMGAIAAVVQRMRRAEAASA